jgi:hypothetical protein
MGQSKVERMTKLNHKRKVDQILIMPLVGFEPTAPQIYIYGFVAYNFSEVIHHDPHRLDTLIFLIA